MFPTHNHFGAHTPKLSWCMEDVSYFQKVAKFSLPTKLFLQELNAQKQDNLQMECIRESNNDLLDYLRSLESEMVTSIELFT